MLWLHPILQLAALLIAIRVLFMGINRFRFQHLKQKCPFNWKGHVKYGKIAAWLWMVGLVFGVYMAQRTWGTTALTGPHYTMGMLMWPFILLGLVTGYLLQKPSGKRPGLALVHGASNVIAFALALYQTWTGVDAVLLLML